MWRAVIVQFSAVGMHCWSDAPDKYAYLREPHRHTFTVKVTASEENGPRSIEINELQDRLHTAFVRMLDSGQLSQMSVEEMAEEIMRCGWLSKCKHVAVEVLEDGINGALVTR